ncbi:MAG TPA: hypothetical protein VD997_17650 [Phycisphaerales bacterium]|nr:hypothetical protein [Phycisphaerales bacterium]
MRSIAVVTCLVLLPIAGCYNPADEERGFTPPLPRPHQQQSDQSHDTGGFGATPLNSPDTPER